MPEGTTFWGVIVKQIALGAVAFAIGVSLFRAIYFERKRKRPWLIAGFAGIAITLEPLIELIIRAPLVDPTREAVTFVVGLFLLAVGFLGDAVQDGADATENGGDDS